MAPAAGKNGTGPSARTSSPEIATDTGNMPRLASMSRLITRPSMSGGDHCWISVITMMSPKPIPAPKSSAAIAAPGSPPRKGISATNTPAPMNAAEATTIGRAEVSRRAATSVPATEPTPRQAISVPKPPAP